MENHRHFNQLCDAGDIEAVQAAIDNGVDVNDANYFGATGLMLALSSCQNDVVQVLLQHPQIDINNVDHHGRSALHFAVIHDNQEGLAALLTHQHQPEDQQEGRDSYDVHC